jgi:P27 family predicted phage terminase small subunit
MSKGRKSISDEAKRMKGTNQPCRMTNEESFIPSIGKLPPPKNLGRIGKRIYKTAGQALINLNILNELNLPQFVQYCKETELYYDIMDQMPTTSDLIHNVYDKRGNLSTQVKALRKIAESALSNSKSLAAEFGLTPSAQSKIIKNITVKKQDPLEAFLSL